MTVAMRTVRRLRSDDPGQMMAQERPTAAVVAWVAQ